MLITAGRTRIRHTIVLMLSNQAMSVYSSSSIYVVGRQLQTKPINQLQMISILTSPIVTFLYEWNNLKRDKKSIHSQSFSQSYIMSLYLPHRRAQNNRTAPSATTEHSNKVKKALKIQVLFFVFIPLNWVATLFWPVD